MDNLVYKQEKLQPILQNGMKTAMKNARVLDWL
jgi:hypothetical protein